MVADDLDASVNPDGSPAKKEIKLKSKIELGYAKTTKEKFEKYEKEKKERLEEEERKLKEEEERKNKSALN